MIDILTPNNLIGSYVTPNPTHKHTKWELVIFEEGVVNNYVNGVPYEASTGDVFLLGPSHLHSIEQVTLTHLHKDLYFEVAEVETLLDIFPESFKQDILSSNTLLRLKLDTQDFNSISKNIGFIKNLQLTQQFSSNQSEMLKPLTKSILQYIFGLYLSNTYKTQNVYPEWFLMFLNKLSKPENFTKDVTTLIAETNYSHTQFGKLFKKYCGIPLIDYFKKIRLSYAAEQLKYTDYTLLFICENCGYDSYSYFERSFKNMFNYTPQQYRKKYSPQEK